MRALERSIVHYGDTTLFIADEMRKHQLGYASAVAMEEATLLDFNRKAGSGEKLVAIYPRDGTFFSDNPRRFEMVRVAEEALAIIDAALYEKPKDGDETRQALSDQDAVELFRKVERLVPRP